MHTQSNQHEGEEQPQLHLVEDNQEADTLLSSSLSSPNRVELPTPPTSSSDIDHIQETNSVVAGSDSSNDNDNIPSTDSTSSSSSPVLSISVGEETAASDEVSVLEVRLSSTTTTTTNPNNHLKGHPIVVVLTVNTLFGFLVLVMNAAITIFGMGIGVGLLLGESFRNPANQNRAGTTTSTNEAAAAVAGGATTRTARASVVVTHHTTRASVAAASSSSSTSTAPSCGRRVVHQQIRVQAPPNLSELAAATMPAQ